MVLVLAGIIGFKFYEPDFEKDSEDGIQFHKGTFREAVEQARDENKLIFMDVYATWCGPCKLLKINTFSSKKAGDYFNEHLINVSVDGEKGDGIKIARKFGVEAYPSLFIIDPHSLSIVDKSTGYKSASQLISFADDNLNKKAS